MIYGITLPFGKVMVYLGLNGPCGRVLGFLLRDAERRLPIAACQGEAPSTIMVEGLPLGPDRSSGKVML